MISNRYQICAFQVLSRFPQTPACECRILRASEDQGFAALAPATFPQVCPALSAYCCACMLHLCYCQVSRRSASCTTLSARVRPSNPPPPVSDTFETTRVSYYLHQIRSQRPAPPTYELTLITLTCTLGQGACDATEQLRMQALAWLNRVDYASWALRRSAGAVQASIQDITCTPCMNDKQHHALPSMMS
jgi:hypothetical protein